MVSRHHTQCQNKGPIPENVGQDDLAEGRLVHEAKQEEAQQTRPRGKWPPRGKKNYQLQTYGQAWIKHADAATQLRDIETAPKKIQTCSGRDVSAVVVGGGGSSIEE